MNALFKFLVQKDPLGTATTLTVTRAELVELLNEHTGDFDAAVKREVRDALEWGAE